jgi:hypothetical protein
MTRELETTAAARPEVARVKTPEDWLFAALLRMVLEHCVTDKGTLDSWGLRANTEPMRLVAEAGFIRIDQDTGERVRATVLPEADAFLARMNEPAWWASHEIKGRGNPEGKEKT